MRVSNRKKMNEIKAESNEETRLNGITIGVEDGTETTEGLHSVSHTNCCIHGGGCRNHSEGGRRGIEGVLIEQGTLESAVELFYLAASQFQSARAYLLMKIRLQDQISQTLQWKIDSALNQKF